MFRKHNVMGDRTQLKNWKIVMENFVVVIFSVQKPIELTDSPSMYPRIGEGYTSFLKSQLK